MTASTTRPVTITYPALADEPRHRVDTACAAYSSVASRRRFESGPAWRTDPSARSACTVDLRGRCPI